MAVRPAMLRTLSNLRVIFISAKSFGFCCYYHLSSSGIVGQVLVFNLTSWSMSSINSVPASCYFFHDALSTPLHHTSVVTAAVYSRMLYECASFDLFHGLSPSPTNAG